MQNVEPVRLFLWKNGRDKRISSGLYCAPTKPGQKKTHIDKPVGASAGCKEDKQAPYNVTKCCKIEHASHANPIHQRAAKKQRHREPDEGRCNHLTHHGS